MIIFLIAAVSVGGFYGYQALNQTAKPVSAKQVSYQTAAVKRGDLSAGVSATGTVRAAQTITLAWQTSGQIAKITVKVGDKVSADQVLASLDEQSLPQTIIMAQSDLVTAKRALDNLKNSAVSQANAQFVLAQAQQAVTDAQHDRDLLDYSRGQNGNADAAWAAYYIAVDAYNKALDRFNKIKNFDITNPAHASIQAALVSAQHNVDQKKNSVDWYTSAPSDNDLAQADAKISMSNAKLGDAQREWDRLKNGPDPDDIAAAQARVDAIQATLSLASLDAPFAGTVTDVPSLVGDQVTPGKVSIRIDDLARLLIDVQVSESDAYRVQVGQPVDISFDAIPGQGFQGKIDSIGSVGQAMGGTINFKVTILLTGNTAQVKPGITATASIRIQQASNVLLVDNRALRTSGGQSVVYVLRSGALVKVPVTIGTTSDAYSEVKEGDLSEGDLVVLNPPLEVVSTPSGK
jgi:HlyD family secretion protein